MSNSTKRNGVKPYRKAEIDLVDIYRLRYVNRLSWAEIAKIGNTSAPNVIQRYNRFVANLPEPEEVELYNQQRAELLTQAELTLLKQIFDKEKLAKASINNIAYAFTQVFQARRLESNQSNINIAIAEVVDRKRKLAQEIASIEAEIAKLSK